MARYDKEKIKVKFIKMCGVYKYIHMYCTTEGFSWLLVGSTNPNVLIESHPKLESNGRNCEKLTNECLCALLHSSIVKKH